MYQTIIERGILKMYGYYDYFDYGTTILSYLKFILIAVFIYYAVMNGITMMYSIGMGRLGFRYSMFLGRWQLFRKMGIEGWKSMIPFYNTYCLMYKLYGRKTEFWLLLIPIVNIIIYIRFYFDLGKSFNKSFGFDLGLLFLNPLFIAILGLSEDKYLDGKYGKRDNFVLGGIGLFTDTQAKRNVAGTCPNCGAELVSGANYCRKCGYKL